VSIVPLQTDLTAYAMMDRMKEWIYKKIDVHDEEVQYGWTRSDCRIFVAGARYLVLYYAKVNDVRHTLFSDYTILASVLPVLISHCVIPTQSFFVFNCLT